MFLGNYIEMSGFIEAHFPVSRGFNVRNPKLSKPGPCRGIDRGSLQLPVQVIAFCMPFVVG